MQFSECHDFFAFLDFFFLDSFLGDLLTSGFVTLSSTVFSFPPFFELLLFFFDFVFTSLTASFAGVGFTPSLRFFFLSFDLSEAAVCFSTGSSAVATEESPSSFARFRFLPFFLLLTFDESSFGNTLSLSAREPFPFLDFSVSSFWFSAASSAAFFSDSSLACRFASRLAYRQNDEYFRHIEHIFKRIPHDEFLPPTSLGA